jgi:hypothetical protein
MRGFETQRASLSGSLLSVFMLTRRAAALAAMRPTLFFKLE